MEHQRSIRFQKLDEAEETEKLLECVKIEMENRYVNSVCQNNHATLIIAIIRPLSVASLVLNTCLTCIAIS